MGHPTMQENDTAKLTPTPMPDALFFTIFSYFICGANSKNKAP